HTTRYILFPYTTLFRSRVDGSNLRDVVTVPGHYTQPSFSPDGRWIVYRAVGDDEIRGITYAENTGVFVASSDGRGEPRKVTDSGTAPMFDHTGERIYLRGNRDGRMVLYSVDL